MTRLTTFIIVTAIALASCASAEAQSRIGPPPRRPTVSPYLNLLRRPNAGGGGLGFNYYQRLLPQQRALQADQRLTSSLSQVRSRQSALQQEIDSGLAPTGHQTSFLNLGGYYPANTGSRTR